MEKYIKKSKKERFASLATCTAIVGGGLFSAIKLSVAADKAEEEGKKTKASVLRGAGKVCSWISGLTALALPIQIEGALEGDKLNPEYEKKVKEIEDEKRIKYAEAENKYQSAISQTVFNAEVEYRSDIRKANLEAEERMAKI